MDTTKKHPRGEQIERNKAMAELNLQGYSMEKIIQAMDLDISRKRVWEIVKKYTPIIQQEKNEKAKKKPSQAKKDL